MSAALWTIILSLVEQAITEAPTLIADVENLLGVIKGTQMTSVAPISPTIQNDPLVTTLLTPATHK